MPIYEYKCKACDLKFEVKRGFSEGSRGQLPRMPVPSTAHFLASAHCLQRPWVLCH